MEDVPRETLEAENARLRAVVDELRGESERLEQEALASILMAVRENAPNIDPESNWARRLVLLGFDLAGELGVHSTLDEFRMAARAR